MYSAISPWTRKHDLPGVPLIPNARILYPQSLQDLIQLCAERQPNERFKAAGSHWALSEVAVSDEIFIETNDPNNVVPAMASTIYDVVPGCLTLEGLQELDRISTPFDAFSREENPTPYYVHIETGKRIYQLYAELDTGEEHNNQSLAFKMQDSFHNSNFAGPWAFQTLGGAGGQTVFGALTTGTHGGDIYLPPIADSVRAIHLVADGGKHYWIEPERRCWIDDPDITVPFTDDDKLRGLYDTGSAVGQFTGKFEIIRDDAAFNAVLVSAGRFGIVYSIVLQAVRQYCLREDRQLSNSQGQPYHWQELKKEIGNIKSPLYNEDFILEFPNFPHHQRFLQIVVNVAASDNGARNRCAITKRWNVPLLLPDSRPVTPPGRPERVGTILLDFDPRLKAPLFSNAGNNFPYNPGSSDPLQLFCQNADFVGDAIDTVSAEIKDFAEKHAVEVGGAVAATGAVGGSAGLAALIPALLAILAALAAFRELLKHSGRTRLGQVLDDLRSALLSQPTSETRAAGIFVWRAIALEIFNNQQKPQTYEAISYAVMDLHNYFDKSCNVNVDSVEVFFNATDPRLVAFVDRVLKFESDQEFLAGKACVGYISLRFMKRTRALIGPERNELTCAVEIAALKDVAGSGELVEYATTLSRDRNIDGILHWGQRNNSVVADIEHRFGGGPLQQWRAALSRFSENGRLDGFSSIFTRRVGLEIASPVIVSFTAELASGGQARSIVAHWDCSQNPPGTNLRIDVVSPSGQASVQRPLDRTGEHSFLAAERGNYRLTLVATIQLGAESRDATKSLTLNVS